jgi:hypothetical protein
VVVDQRVFTYKILVTQIMLFNCLYVEDSVTAYIGSAIFSSVEISMEGCMLFLITSEVSKNFISLTL